MKLKKLLAAGLSVALGLSLSAPALAAEAADERLTRVTLAVKGTLGIGEEYTEFYGEPDETALGTRWSLTWKNEDEELNVTATGEGKVLSLNRWEGGSVVEPVTAGSSGGLSFPAMSRSQAGTCAQTFLSKVLEENEVVTFTDEWEESLSAESYSFRGTVALNGLPSPMTVFVRVRLSDGAVTRFWRGDLSDYAGTPGAAETAVTEEAARALLKGTLSLRLEYVLEWDGKEDSEKKAVLRYLPNTTDAFYVDAATGDLVNLTELQAKLRQQYDAAAGDMKTANTTLRVEAAADEGEATLTDVELEGVAKLEGVLDKEALDQKIRAWQELGLEAYTLGTAGYSVDRETGEVTARVSYARNTAEGICRRYVTVDAKTGALLGMYGSNPYRTRQDGAAYITARAAQTKGEAFLKALWPDQYGKTEVYNAPDGDADATEWSFTFAQKVNGYFFPGNSITVRVDAANGSIMGFSKSFDDAMTFDSAQGLISEEAAVAAWCGTFPVELAYLEVPVALDMTQEFELLRSAGYSYYNALKPGYALGERDGWYTGVDAKTGEPVKTEQSQRVKMAYDDLEGHWAADILNELARYNVGWQGGKAEADKALTQLDYIVLLAAANGYSYDPANDGDTDRLYDFVIRQGLLTGEERQEDKALTRGEMVKMLLDSMGYRHVAGLKGIFRCDFADADTIAAEQLGYAALAQGLGLVTGDSQNNYAPDRPAVRCEGAVLLWKAMKR